MHYKEKCISCGGLCEKESDSSKIPPTYEKTAASPKIFDLVEALPWYQCRSCFLMQRQPSAMDKIFKKDNELKDING